MKLHCLPNIVVEEACHKTRRSDAEAVDILPPQSYAYKSVLKAGQKMA